MANGTDSTTSTASQSSILTEGVQILLLTGVGYLVAFLYEKGYCDHFGIPMTLIVPSTATILVAIVSIALIGIALLPVFNIALAVARGLRSSEAIKPYFSLVFGNFIILMALLIGWMLFGLSKMVIAVTVGLMLIINVSSLAPVLLMYKKCPTWRERFMAVQQANAGDKGSSEIGRLAERIFGKRGWNVILDLYVVLAFAHIAGSAAAVAQTEFDVLDEYPGYVLLREYGEFIVAAKVDEDKKQTGMHFLLLRLSDAKELMLTRKKLGPLGHTEL